MQWGHNSREQGKDNAQLQDTGSCTARQHIGTGSTKEKRQKIRAKNLEIKKSNQKKMGSGMGVPCVSGYITQMLYASK